MHKRFNPTILILMGGGRTRKASQRRQAGSRVLKKGYNFTGVRRESRNGVERQGNSSRAKCILQEVCLMVDWRDKIGIQSGDSSMPLSRQQRAAEGLPVSEVIVLGSH